MEGSICIFSLSSADIFHGGVDEAVKWLEGKRKGPSWYHFRDSKPSTLPPGSVVLFSMEGKIFGQAIVKEGIKITPTKRREQLKKETGFYYRFYLTLEPSSIEIFDGFPSKKDVELEVGVRFGRLFTYVEWKQYIQIISMAGKKSFNIEKRFKKEIMSLSKRQICELIRQRDAKNEQKVGSRDEKSSHPYRRDPILALCLKRLYEDSCQIANCLSGIKVDRGFFTDTHHIVPLEKGGTDTSPNILVLCPNHHRLFHRSKVRLVKRTSSEVTLRLNGKSLKALFKQLE